MVGVAMVEALKQPTALGGPWKVYGAARRPLPSWFPSSFLDEYMTFDALNLEDTHKSLSKISHEVTHVFWLALQVVERFLGYADTLKRIRVWVQKLREMNIIP
nr:3-oxo-Delta(4,5)-steroid 5-beta-reductase-like [Ipomoea batatas]